MTPGERQYDIKLIKSMHDMAQWIAPRSAKISQTLLAGAERLEALSSAAPVEQPPEIDASGNKIQPASTPDRAQKLEPVRD